ncbi:MAG TPA: M50 family metallopeptidase [Actinoplanes sp.]|nr:M50 family metallopeptidase [Actinoplanes sp.]
MSGLELAAAAASPGVAMQAAVIAWVLAVPLYFVTRWIGAVVHEGGHAIVAMALLRGVYSIRFNRNGGGETERQPVMWPFGILISFAGYTGPSMFGLVAAWLLLHGRTDAVLWGSMAFLVMMLLVMRGFIGWLVVPVLIFVLYEITTSVEPPRQLLLAHVWTWFMLIYAVQQMIVYIHQKHYENPKSDTGRLRGYTMLPSVFWAAVLLATTIFALGWGGAMLLGLS